MTKIFKKAPLKCLSCFSRLDYEDGQAECTKCEMFYIVDEFMVMVSKLISGDKEDINDCSWIHWDLEEQSNNVMQCEYIDERGNDMDLPINTPFNITPQKLKIILTFG